MKRYWKRSCATCIFWHEDKSCGAVNWVDIDDDEVPDEGWTVKLLNITKEECAQSPVGVSVYTGPDFFCISHEYRDREGGTL